MRLPTALFVGIMVFSFAPFAFAQLESFGDIMGAASSLTLSVSPARPSPNSSVHISIQSPLIDLAGSSISWSVNGKAGQSGVGLSGIDVPVGALGTETTVSATVSSSMGSGNASVSIIPGSVDLLWEANSYAPAFYEGRRLATSGTVIRLLAVPHLVSTKTKQSLSADSLTYSWRRGGSLVSSISGVGKSAATFTAPALFGSETYSVEVTSADGSTGASGSVSVTTGDPVLALYEDNPLFGVRYGNAIDSTNSTDAEISVVAVPYFVSPDRRLKLSYVWHVNGGTVPVDTQSPNEITIHSQNGGTAAITLSASDPKNAFFSGSGSWSILFGSGSTGGSSSGASDAFHTTTQ